ncbi:hypothetical protein CALVIDRAFT_602933 [Calocera viscosa TUFC12733]|uniref:NACHT domain-containing protein n=1 Tax=Calocera viscosa (strain TUFC12733) TaxID=1330018 RepID=A0A167GEE4_CALVF|nr:hypothetical protein CALVIDRAFT_602933 [Calocera viscosa TUFC12733]
MTSTSAAADPHEAEQLRLTYICTGVTIQDLPTRGLLKSKGKYYITISIDGKKAWKTREIQTRESTVVWEEAEDKTEFDASSASKLKVTVWKRHNSRPMEQVGTVELPLTEWLQAISPTALNQGSPSSDTSPILAKLSVTKKDDKAPDTILKNPLPNDFEEADSDATAAFQRKTNVLDTISAAVDKVDVAKDSATDICKAWDPLLEKLTVFADLMDKVSEVHPYVKMAWTVLSAAYKLVKGQQDRDKEIRELLEKLKTVYELLCDAEEFRAVLNDKAREGVLSRLAVQTVDCAQFISSCTKNTDFKTRLIKQSLSNISDRITEYSKKFDNLLEEFRTGSQLRTEVMTTLILDDIKDLGKEIDLDKIPYAGGAGYEPSRRCLDNTRKVLLEKIGNWASSTEDNTPRLLVLMGPAGTGKSTIAHTVVHRFRTIKRLGASFCFSTNASATRRPVNLFRNIARELANFSPAFKTALRNAVMGDLNLCTTEDLEEQLNKFILEPSQALATCGTIFIMIDALDESGTEKVRRKLVRLLFTSLRRLPTGFRVLLTCRAEQDILEILERPTSSVTIVRMPTTEQDKTLSADIFTYIRHVLEDEGNTFSKGMDEGCCIALRDRAEGLFQWAFVACDYIVTPRIGRTVVDRYNEVLSGTAGRTGLDGLYMTVLMQILDKDVGALESFCAVMGFVLITVEPLSMRSLRTMMELLPQNPRMAPDDILPFLGSLLSGVGEEATPVRPLHSSFWELLQSAERGGPYYIGASGHHERLLVASLRLLQSRLEFNMGGMESSYQLNRDIAPSSRLKSKVTEGVLYACKHWGYHLSKCGPGCEGTAEVRELLHDLFMRKLLFWIDVASVAGVVRGIVDCLNIAMDRLPPIGDDVVAMAHDCIKFIRAFGRAIVDSAPHTYLSALPSAPTRSTISRSFHSPKGRFARIASGRPTQWSVVSMIMRGHRDEATSVAFSLDNRRIISGSYDKTVRVWDAETGEAVGNPLTAHRGGVTSLAFSRDNRRIVSGSLDRTVRIWDAETGEAVGDPLIGHNDSVTSVAFSPDSRRIVSGSRGNTIRIWNVETGEAAVNPLSGHSDIVESVAFSPDNRRIASGSKDNTVRIWDAEGGQAVGHPLMAHNDAVTSVAFSSDNQRIVSGSLDDTIRIWDAETGKTFGGVFVGQSPHCFRVMGPDGPDMGVETGEAIGNPRTDHSDWVTSVAFSLDNRRIVSGSFDNTVRIWDAETGEAVGDPLTGQSDAVTSVAFSSSDVASRWVTSVAFSPDNRRIVSGFDDNTIRIWYVDTAEAPRRHAEEPSNCLSHSDDAGGARLAAATFRPGTLSLSPHAAHQLRQLYGSDETGQPLITFDYETGWIIGNGRDHILWVPPDQLRRLYTGQTQLVIPGPTIHVDLSRFVHASHSSHSSHSPSSPYHVVVVAARAEAVVDVPFEVMLCEVEEWRRKEVVVVVDEADVESHELLAFELAGLLVLALVLIMLDVCVELGVCELQPELDVAALIAPAELVGCVLSVTVVALTEKETLPDIGIWVLGEAARIRWLAGLEEVRVLEILLVLVLWLVLVFALTLLLRPATAGVTISLSILAWWAESLPVPWVRRSNPTLRVDGMTPGESKAEGTGIEIPARVTEAEGEEERFRVTVQGLPTRSILKSESRYFITITIDEVQVWKSREIRSKESTVGWDKEEDKHEFECPPTASLKATLWKNHNLVRPVEEVGTVMLRLSSWLHTLMVAQVVTRTSSKDPILIRLSLSRKDTTSPAPEITLREHVQTTDADIGAATLQPEFTAEMPTAAAGDVRDFTHGLGDIAKMLEELRDKLDLFTTSMDEMPEIHPYLRMSWTILSATIIGSEVVEAQQQRVQSIKRLIAKITTVYELLCDAQVLRDDKARMVVLSRLALQTVDCAHFISSCIENTKFVTRLASPSASKIAIQIDEYNNIFDALLRDFQTGSQVRTEIATSIIVEDIKALGVAIDLENIPYTGGAGYEPSRRCLENTRKVLLEEIGNWASSTDADTPGVLLLMGPAGTGKSTIAHTIAHRFREMNRLGASFCFSTSASATRRPVNLFRNIARELASFHPAFKASLQNAIRNDLNLCTTEDLELQFNKYILEPARALAINGTTLIMIDGLHESGTEKERRKLVRLLLTLLGGLPIGFRVLLTCRAEQDILKVVERPTSSVTIVRMPTTEQDRTLSTDVLTYIRHVLEDEGNTFSQGMDEGCCVALRDRAEGLFQWAFVFDGGRRYGRQERWIRPQIWWDNGMGLV